MAAPQKVSLYSTNDLKNTTDDAIAPYLTTLSSPYTFKQQHYLTDIKLIAGYTAVIIAGILFYADWKLGWEATKPYTAPACVAYFLLNGFFTYWIWAVETGTVFVGVREGGQKITLKSSAKKQTPNYKLKVLYEAPSGKKFDEREISGTFMEWFNVHGYLQKKAFRSWLARNIEVIGLADPASKAAGEEKKDDGIVEGDTVTIVATGNAVEISETTTKPRKAKKKA